MVNELAASLGLAAGFLPQCLAARTSALARGVGQLQGFLTIDCVALKCIHSD